MILRALFWIAVVGVLMPHQPDLGLGRPGAVTSLLPAPAAAWVDQNVGTPRAACDAHAEGCATALGMIDTLQSAAVASLAEVKAEIEASKHARQTQRFAYNDWND